MSGTVNVVLDINPQPKQVEFFKSTTRYTLFGGARGGGKSWAARAKLELLCLQYPGIQCCLIRRVRADLYKNHMPDMLKDLENAGLARWKQGESAFVFEKSRNSRGVPSRIYFEFCDADRDIGKFQGPAYDVMSVEEATQFTPSMIDAMKQSNRPSGFVEMKGFKPRMYFTANPGGPGHAEIKRVFIDKNFRINEREEDYYYIQALVYDNKVLLERDPNYVRVLENLPPAKMKAMLYGDWNAYEGQFFEQFTDNAEGYDNRIMSHVIRPFEIPASWPRYMSYDYGSRKPYSMHWWAVSGDGRLYCYREDYGCADNMPDTGSALTIKEQAARIIEAETSEREDGLWVTRVADPAIFHKDTTRMREGESIADMFAKDGIHFGKASNVRVPGWEQVSHRMKFDENGRPLIYFFRNCVHLIRTIPLMMSDVHRPEDIDTNMEDHAVDDMRYICNTVRLNVESVERARRYATKEEAQKKLEAKMSREPVVVKPTGGWYG